MTYDDGMAEESVAGNEKLLGIKGGLRTGVLAWLEGPHGRRLVVTEKGRWANDQNKAEEAVARRLAHWR